MKLIFKIFISSFLIFNSFAREVVLITFDKEDLATKALRKIIKEDPAYSETLIKLRQMVNPCVANKKTVLHLCVKDLDLILLHQNIEVLKYAFAGFRKE